MQFARPQLMMWNGNKITEHNRSELGWEYQRIGKETRMWNGTMRRQHINLKRTFSVSWDMVPATTAKTVDGFWGAQDMAGFYETTPGAFPLVVTYGNGTTTTYTVMFDSFSKAIQKRGSYDMWSVNVSLIEV